MRLQASWRPLLAATARGGGVSLCRGDRMMVGARRLSGGSGRDHTSTMRTGTTAALWAKRLELEAYKKGATRWGRPLAAARVASEHTVRHVRPAFSLNLSLSTSLSPLSLETSLPRNRRDTFLARECLHERRVQEVLLDKKPSDSYFKIELPVSSDSTLMGQYLNFRGGLRSVPHPLSSPVLFSPLSPLPMHAACGAA